MIIKVCGMREPDNIRAVEALRPDWMGFIFWPGSRRCVTTPPAYLPQPPLNPPSFLVLAFALPPPVFSVREPLSI